MLRAFRFFLFQKEFQILNLVRQHSSSFSLPLCFLFFSVKTQQVARRRRSKLPTFKTERDEMRCPSLPSSDATKTFINPYYYEVVVSLVLLFFLCVCVFFLCFFWQMQIFFFVTVFALFFRGFFALFAVVFCFFACFLQRPSQKRVL